MKFLQNYIVLQLEIDAKTWNLDEMYEQVSEGSFSASVSVRKKERILKVKNLNQKTRFNKKAFSSSENEMRETC